MPRPEAFKALRALGDERVADVDDMLSRGMPASAVARVIQEEWGELKDRQTASVKKMLERYRGSDLREKMIAEVRQATHGISISTLRKKLNAMDELEQLVMVQKSRFEKMLLRERTGPLLLKQVTEEGKLLKEMLVDLGKLQLETGVLRRAPRTVSGTVTDEFGNVRAFAWTEEQERLYRQLENVEYRVVG
jgi:hypothetical protein